MAVVTESGEELIIGTAAVSLDELKVLTPQKEAAMKGGKTEKGVLRAGCSQTPAVPHP
jgi:hypothetical protein